jgi:xylan 1,4-beta-xylosidase
MTVTFTSRLSAAATPLKHAWEHTVGSSRALLALRADWQEQLRRCHEELGFRHVRFHALLTDDMGTLICHQERPLYSFFNADRIWDFLLSIGMRPFVELSFMPEMLASGHETVFHFRGNVTPPADYDAWATLIRKLVGHWVERYGIAEVSQWFFEVWNEPNFPAFWTGTQDDYFKLYGHTAQAIKAVDASLRVGGPATAMTGWIDELLDYCERNRLPVDFISTHIYATDPLGFEGANTEEQLANSPRDLMRDRAKLVREHSRERPVYFTEWNISSNPRDLYHDEPFAAAYAAKIALETDPFVDGPSPTSSTRTTSPRSHSMAGSVCSISTAPRSPSTVPSSSSTGSAASASPSPARTRRSMPGSFAKAGRSRCSSRTTPSRATTS